MTDFQQIVASSSSLFIKQQRELAELFGFETRNKYLIETPDGQAIGFVAEQQKSWWGFFMRQSFGHWRRFDLHFYNDQRQEVFIAHHPFRWFFQRLELSTFTGEHIGTIERRWAIFTKKFDVIDKSGNLLMSVSSPFWRIWTFPFMKNGQSVAVISKRWGGILREGFTDADTFETEFSPGLPLAERLLILAAGVYVDLLFFERKANNQSSGVINNFFD